MKKKVLMLCREVFSIPFFFLEDSFIKDGYETGLFHIHPEECLYNECDYNHITYYELRKKSKSKLYDVKDISDKFVSEYKNPNIDYDYLKYVEENYTYFKPLNLQLMSSQFNTRYYHFREKYNFTTKEQNLYCLELFYKKAEQVLDDFKPDYIIDLDTAELMRTVINEVAYKKKIPYISIEHPRYESFKIPTFNIGLNTDEYFKKKYNDNYHLSEDELKDEYAYIKDYRAKQQIMPYEYKNSVTAKYEKDSIMTSLKSVLRTSKMINDIDAHNKKFRRKAKDCILLTKYFGLIKDFISWEYIRQKLFKPNKYFQAPIDGEKYLYMPLHLIPESTTFVKAPYYVNELNVIEQVSKSLPIGLTVYVKEHQSMLGERPISFYKSVAKLHNVKMVQFNYYKDPNPWLDKAVGVITITGTGAYEAALLGKKSLIFGNVCFDVIDSINKITSMQQLPEYLKTLGNVDNIHSCAAYIKTVKEVGTELKINYLIDEGYKILENKSEITNEYKNEIDKLYEFYKKSFKIYDENK